jgi:PAS domain S-box-containing protein
VQIVGSARDAIISTDRSGRIVSWNPGAEELYGRTASGALGQPISMIIPGPLKGEEWGLLRRALAGERIERYETQRLSSDGRTLDVSLTLFALRDAGGQIVGAASIARDISERVAAQRELRQSEGRYRQILESASEGIWRVDTELVTDYANRSLAEMLGYTVEEMLGRHLSEFMDEGRLRDAVASTERQIHGARERMEVVFLRRDGSHLRALISVNGLFDETGRHVGNLAMVTDISQQREIEMFLAGLTASMEEGMLTLDAAGRIATANVAAERYLGYGGDELLGRRLCACVDREQRDTDRHHRPLCPGAGPGPGCGLGAILGSVSPIRLDDEVFVCGDGRRLPVALSAAPVGGSPQRPSGYVVVFRDISERKAASEHEQRELEELTWMGRLSEAMDEDRLVLAAQPIVALASGAVSHRELLVRLRDRAGLLVMPGKFLPAAERSGLIRELDRWVVREAGGLAAADWAVNVNLSAHSLGDPELGALVERSLRDAGADPRLITFELTETALTEHPRLACRFAEHMASIGCTFALDDFGTGYGAFTYLKLLPISYLKIDREFVHDVAENRASRHVVQAMVSLARGFGQQTIAEGVESEAALTALRELGVDHVQGYHVGLPVVVER